MTIPARLDHKQLELRVVIQPKASRDKIIGLHGDEIKIAITAPPVDGQANKHLTAFLAKQLKVAKGAVTIIKGEQSRHKVVQINAPKQIPAEINKLLSDQLTK